MDVFHNRATRPTARSDFRIAIICALRVESDAVEALFDQFWEDEGHRFDKANGDPNSYKLGRIGPHNVVLAYLPGMGKVSSANAAGSFRVSFPNIQLGLVVGICGGVPRSAGHDKEIFLGEVIISTGVVQFDHGWQYSDGPRRKDTAKDNSGRPNAEVRAFLRQMQGWDALHRLQRRIPEYAHQVARTEGFESWKFPNASSDKLYEPGYRHKHQNSGSCTICARCIGAGDKVCEAALNASCAELGCSDKHLITGRNRSEEGIHFGVVASGDKVMKSVIDRDLIADKDNVIGFEMEGAGFWDSFPTIIVKGVSDYADSHKNDEWHQYAAVTAAACAKALLQEWRGTDLMPSPYHEPIRTPVLNPGIQTTYAGNPHVVFHNYSVVKNQTHEQHIGGDLNIG